MKFATFLVLVALVASGGALQLKQGLNFASHTIVVADGSEITDFIDVDFAVDGNVCGVFDNTLDTYTCDDYYLACCKEDGSTCALPNSPGGEGTTSVCDSDFPYVGCCVIPGHSYDDGECTPQEIGYQCPDDQYAVCYDSSDSSPLYDMLVTPDTKNPQDISCDAGFVPWCCPPTS